jgi:hypothetical protein
MLPFVDRKPCPRAASQWRRKGAAPPGGYIGDRPLPQSPGAAARGAHATHPCAGGGASGSASAFVRLGFGSHGRSEYFFGSAVCWLEGVCAFVALLSRPLLPRSVMPRQLQPCVAIAAFRRPQWRQERHPACLIRPGWQQLGAERPNVETRAARRHSIPQCVWLAPCSSAPTACAALIVLWSSPSELTCRALFRTGSAVWRHRACRP